jgi:DNA-binding transcriptional MerR regulator
MSSQILSLFGDELIPEQINAVGKSRAAKKKAEEKKPEEKKEAKHKEEPKAEETPKIEATVTAPVVTEQPVVAETPVVQPSMADKLAAARKAAEEPKLVKSKPPVKAKPVKPRKAAKVPKEAKRPEVLDSFAPDKQYYSIGEVSALFQVNTSHIRFWTNEFEIKVRTTRKGDRLYSPDQINELRVIYDLVKGKGYTIAGAKAKLKSAKKAPSEAIDLKYSLLQLRNKLLQIRNQI